MMKVMAWSAGGHDESRARLLTFVVLMIKNGVLRVLLKTFLQAITISYL
ncbi:MAG TPA: hypothetical protein PK325_08105 [Cyclobacteriaceae bacterium]|nr:hypothetical protein [Cyclobacteriaceae bacterium]HMV08528.1 hypothetical protein [Cyclobacteriaceae bacterium]HMV90016.1 hypothetical protein [Cyclobacteriaceae bacterium]HMX01301.1 hypothetical protein [Cyclobacteriaceae bacterium]HMX51285.1 hypothetical protein [Cyclobacteriaceae bacterium]